jgi:membrane protease YdiL (CAAX protease family)
MKNNENTIGIIPDSSENSGYSAKLLRKSSNGNSLILIIFTAFMFLGSFLAANIANAVVGKDSEYFKGIVLILSMIIQHFIGIPLALFIFRKTKIGQGTDTIRSVFRKPQQSFWWVVRWILIAVFFSYAASLATNMFFMFLEKITGVSLVQTDFSAENNTFSQVVNIISITFMAPLFEEILIRGGMLNNIKRFGSWSAIISTGIFFGLLHMNYPQVPFAAVMGIVTAFIALKTKSIIPTIITHFIVNSIGGVMSLITGGLDIKAIQNGDISSLLENPVVFVIYMGLTFLVIGLMAVGLVLFILECILHRDSFRFEKINPEVSEGKKLCHYFTAPLTILLTLFYIGMTILNAIPQ